MNFETTKSTKILSKNLAKREGGLRTEGMIKKSIPDKPLISVITVVFNGAQFIEQTILSVLSQEYDNYEFIIVDGSSKDGTLDILKKYEKKIDFWISEKDQGIYDAMNKGIDLATGDWINFLNAGDVFVDKSTLSSIDFKNFHRSAVVYGNKIQTGTVIKPFALDRLKYGEIMGCHQSMFFNLKNPFRKDIRYDTSYPIYGDYELVNRLYLKYGKFQYVDIEIAVFQGGGISSKISKQKRIDKYRAIYKSYGFVGLIRALFFRLCK